MGALEPQVVRMQLDRKERGLDQTWSEAVILLLQTASSKSVSADTCLSPKPNADHGDDGSESEATNPFLPVPFNPLHD